MLLLFRTYKNAFSRHAINTLACLYDMLIKPFLLFKNTSKNTKKPLLLLIRPDAVGDYIVWSQSAVAYKKIFPLHHIIYIGNPACAELAATSGCFDEVWPVDRKKFILDFFYRFKILKKIRNYAFDTVIYPVFSREFASGDAMVRWTLAKNKITAETDYAIDAPFWLRISQTWYTQIIPAARHLVHELHKNHYLVNQLSDYSFELTLPKIGVGMSGSLHSQPYYIVFAGARIAIREWPPEKFALSADYIYQKTGWKGLLVGSNADFERNEVILKYAKAPLENWAGKTSLVELARLISGAAFLIGNETSGIHIAAAVNTPAICLLGGGHFGRFVPYPNDLMAKSAYTQLSVYESMPCFGCNWNCIYTAQKYKPVPCVAQISTQNVVSAIDRMLKLIG